MKRHASTWATGAILGVVVFIASYPLTAYGVPRGHDWSHELVRVAQVQTAWTDGQFPAAWAPDLYRGWGSPIYLFYAPLFASTSAFVAKQLGGIESGVVVTLALLLVLATVGIFLASQALSHFEGRDRSPPDGADTIDYQGARIAVYLFLFSPYFLSDLYRRNAFSEFTALCLAPLLLAAIFVAYRSPRWARFGVLLTSAAIVLAHNLSALVFCAITLGSIAFLYGFDRAESPARRAILAGGGFGIALTMWFWWPALTLQPLIRSEELLRGKFHFEQNFPSWSELFGWGHAASTGPLVALVLLATLMSLPGVPLRSSTWRARSSLLLGGLLLLLLMRPVSTPLWSHLPWMRLLQFPWRLAGPLALIAALLGGLCFQRLTTTLT
ncbi:MAG: hypothetical protein K8J08_04695, partial [Thermoanaerobaculia bacterium]|nr:hypothetical protein [Thermoanaerobaculia bacterium]